MHKCVVKIQHDFLQQLQYFSLLNSADKMKELRAYLNSLASAEVAPAERGTKIVHEEVVGKVEREVEQIQANNRRRKRIKMQVKPHLLYRVS